MQLDHAITWLCGYFGSGSVWVRWSSTQFWKYGPSRKPRSRDICPDTCFSYSEVAASWNILRMPCACWYRQM